MRAIRLHGFQNVGPAGGAHPDKRCPECMNVGYVLLDGLDLYGDGLGHPPISCRTPKEWNEIVGMMREQMTDSAEPFIEPTPYERGAVPCPNCALGSIIEIGRKNGRYWKSLHHAELETWNGGRGMHSYWCGQCRQRVSHEQSRSHREHHRGLEKRVGVDMRLVVERLEGRLL